MASPREMSERALHEYVAEVEGHESQVTGVVGYFYQMYRAEVLARIGTARGRLPAAVRRPVVRYRGARRRARAHARAMAHPRRSAAGAQTGRPRDHGRSQ